MISPTMCTCTGIEAVVILEIHRDLLMRYVCTYMYSTMLYAYILMQSLILVYVQSYAATDWTYKQLRSLNSFHISLEDPRLGVE